MKKTVLVIAFIFMLLSKGKGQNMMSDRLHIHQMIIEKVESGEEKYNVFNQTRRQEYRDYNFQDPSGIDTTEAKIYNRKSWRQFLNSIDTTLIKDYSLKVKRKFQFNPSVEPTRSTLIFSPVIFDSTYSRAVCVTKFSGNDSVTKSAWYLTKEENKWVIKEVQFLSISCF